MRLLRLCVLRRTVVGARSRLVALRLRTIRLRTIVRLSRGPIVSRRRLCRTIVVRLRLIGLRTIRLRTIIRLGLIRFRLAVRLSRRTIVPRGRLCRTIIVRLRLIRLRPVIRLGLIGLGPIVRLRRRWTIIPRRRLCRTVVVRLRLVGLRTVRLRPIIRLGLIRFRPVVRLRRLVIRTIRLRRGRARAFVSNWRVSRPIRWLIGCGIGGLAAGPSHGGGRGLSRRSLLDRRMRRSGITYRTQFRHLLAGKRLSWMRCQRLLPSGEGHGRRRRCRLCDDLAIGYRSWRRCHTVRRVGVRSEYCVGGWRNCHPGIHGRRGNLPGVHAHCRSRDGLCAGKGPLRNRGDRTIHVLVDVGDVVDRRVVVDDGSVIDIRDRGLVHGGVADVHAINVATAHAIRRHIHFSRTQREPAHVATESAGTSADKYDKSGRVHWPHCRRSWDPSPTTADRSPAAIVKWRVAPRLVINPGPTPGIDPGPVPITIRRPTGGHMRVPDVAVAGIGTPVTVLIEIFVARPYRERRSVRTANLGNDDHVLRSSYRNRQSRASLPPELSTCRFPRRWRAVQHERYRFARCRWIHLLPGVRSRRCSFHLRWLLRGIALVERWRRPGSAYRSQTRRRDRDRGHAH